MDFCVAILILKMEGNMEHFWPVLLYYFKKGKTATETQKRISAVCGEGAVTDQMCQKWFVKFRAGDFSLDDAPRLGKPVEADSGQIKTLRTINVTPMQDSQQTQHVQINRVMGENKNYVFYFTEKTIWTF